MPKTGRVCVHVRMCEKESVEGQVEGTYMKVIIWIFGGFSGGSVVKNLPTNTGDTGDVGLIPGWERSPGEGNGNPLQYSCLENPMDWGAWWSTVHGVTKSQVQLSTNDQLTYEHILVQEAKFVAGDYQ